MKYTGTLKTISKDIETSKFLATFSINQTMEFSRDYQELQSLELLDISAEKHRNKRSIDSNNYAWLLLSKIAIVQKTTKEEIYLVMLERYSEFCYLPIPCNDENLINSIKKVYRIVNNRGKSTMTTEKGKEIEVYTFQCYIGSSLFDSKQMSIFVEGIVSEAKELGIETMTPEEIKIMNSKWKGAKE